MKTLRDIGEFGLIHHLQRHIPRAGDDCAVLPGGDLLTCDPVIEGVHYKPATPPYRVGWKAMARNLSDIAAMAGCPRYAVVSLGLRPATPVRYVTELYRGMRAVARQFHCEIVGGDTARVRGPQFIVVTLLGHADRPVLRSGARPGDHVFVTGKLGGSFASGKHLTFTPRIREAHWLARHCRIHAMLDISDGLASDLQRLVESSRVGFDISSAQIPISTAVRRGSVLVRRRSPDRAVPADRQVSTECGVGRPSHNETLGHALTDGEDFELLFTVSPRDAGKLRAKFFEIGRVIRKPVVLLDGQPLSAQGYDHFTQRR
jgi:thiamine-monophosphate kinase